MQRGNEQTEAQSNAGSKAFGRLIGGLVGQTKRFDQPARYVSERAVLSEIEAPQAKIHRQQQG